MNILIQWTEQDFERITGHKPEDDDLDRTNCKEAGSSGHWGCGICIHNRPVFMCHKCFVKASLSPDDTSYLMTNFLLITNNWLTQPKG